VSAERAGGQLGQLVDHVDDDLVAQGLEQARRLGGRHIVIRRKVRS